MSDRYDKLKALLRELFQLNQPELDFGLYRIMHAKSAEVSRFLDDELLPQVQESFKQYRSADRAGLERELQEAIEKARELGTEPEDAPKVKDLRVRLEERAVDIGALETEVYDHLYRFFRRYYSDGDFLSKRVYKPGVYAIPYEGEEVKLHWANADQYYTKSSEYLRDYAFRLRPVLDGDPMRVHFRLMDAAEGEHGDVKEGKDRVFVLAPAGESDRDFLSDTEGDEGPELVVRFEYRPATMQDWPEQKRAEERKRLKHPRPPKQDDLNALAARRILGVSEPALARWIKELGKPHVRADGKEADYTRLEAHLRRYTARNTFDYFIHKDLGGFLRRELDFYIKNEVMHLDDIESESVLRVEQYLSKIKVIRRITGKIIDFLSQLEDFQKKLWLKRKFVVETSWCVRLGCIPEELHPEITSNDEQRREWLNLHGIDQLQGDQGDLTRPPYSEPLTPEFLRSNPTLMVDTRHFDDMIEARLLEAIEDLDAWTDGVLIHSENFQALNLMDRRYRERVKCVYIDPPYNTGGDDFLYKDRYQHSAWLSMLTDRLLVSRLLLSRVGAVFITLDDTEQPRLREALDESNVTGSFLANIIWKKKSSPDARSTIGSIHDHLLCYINQAEAPKDCIGKMPLSAERRRAYTNPDDDPRGPWASVDMTGMVARATDDQFYDVELPSGRLISPPEGRSWGLALRTFEQLRADGRIWFGASGDNVPRIKKFLEEADGQVAPTVWDSKESGSNDDANGEIASLFGTSTAFQSPKPTKLIGRILGLGADQPDSLTLDYFAGSGTTGHAVINLNREDGGARKFILVEMGDYFDTVLLPRLKKVTFTPEWKDGRPQRLATPEEAERSPRVFKVVHLESYEDTLNNLDVGRTEAQRELLDHPDVRGADGFREEYLLRYMLEVETHGSPSLLNIRAFDDPTDYVLRVKRPGTDETRATPVDLVETFNWLLGLRVEQLRAPRSYGAKFRRDREDRLRLDGELEEDLEGPYWFRAVGGEAPDGRKVLVIWRKRTGNPEKDNLVLDEWFSAHYVGDGDVDFDLVYTNGGSNLENLKGPEDLWTVRLVEDDFLRLMFAAEGG